MASTKSRLREIVPPVLSDSRRSVEVQMARTDPNQLTFDDAEVLISPKRAAEMLDVSRSEIDRIADRAGWTRIPLSDAKRGAVRYRLKEVMQFIQNRTVTRLY
jgi:hypothetical protein